MSIGKVQKAYFEELELIFSALFSHLQVYRMKKERIMYRKYVFCNGFDKGDISFACLALHNAVHLRFSRCRKFTKSHTDARRVLHKLLTAALYALQR